MIRSWIKSQGYPFLQQVPDMVSCFSSLLDSHPKLSARRDRLWCRRQRHSLVPRCRVASLHGSPTRRAHAQRGRQRLRQGDPLAPGPRLRTAAAWRARRHGAHGQRGARGAGGRGSLEMCRWASGRWVAIECSNWAWLGWHGLMEGFGVFGLFGNVKPDDNRRCYHILSRFTCLTCMFLMQRFDELKSPRGIEICSNII